MSFKSVFSLDYIDGCLRLQCKLCDRVLFSVPCAREDDRHKVLSSCVRRTEEKSHRYCCPNDALTWLDDF